MTNALFEIRNLKHCYKERVVLEEESFDLYPGTITGITGPNGSGKSTLINILGLIIKPTEGTLRFMGEQVAPFSEIARERIATLTQDSTLLKRNVFENVAYGLMIRKDTNDLEKRVAESLEAVGLSFSSFACRSVKALSGGEARRVALAARLILKPRMLLLDEPTAHVDEHSNTMIRRAVLHARERWGTTLVISSHDREWLESICDRTITVFNGCLFKEERLNILTGPFEKRGDYGYKIGINPGDCNIPVPMSPDLNNSAILPASALYLALESSRIPDNAISFKSRIIGVSLSRSKEHLYVSLSCADCCLVSIIDSSEAGSFIPGQTVNAYYDPAALSLR